MSGLFAYHELKLAAQDVKSSKFLSALFSPLTALADKVSSLRSGLAGGKYNPADINGVQDAGGGIAAAAAAKGYPTADIPAHIPGIAGS